MSYLTSNWKLIAILAAIVGAMAVVINLDRIIYGEYLTPRARPSFADPHFQGAKADFKWVPDSSKDDRGLFTQTVCYPGTQDVRVVKTVHSIHKWLAKTQYIDYKFFRKDGSKERSLIYYPPDGSGICDDDYRETLYDVDGETAVIDRWVRFDGTVASEERHAEGVRYGYRADGKTLHAMVSFEDGKGWVTTHFLPDGVTAWYKFYHSDRRTVVCLDWDKKPYQKSFSRENLQQGWTTYRDVNPTAVYAHNYEREDGTREYRQTWYAVWDTEQNRGRHGIGQVEVYAADGKTVTAVYYLDWAVRPKVTKAAIYDENGGCLERTYRKPGCRRSERRFDSQVRLVDDKDFPESDLFEEPVDKRIFQGFGESMYFEEPGPSK